MTLQSHVDSIAATMESGFEGYGTEDEYGETQDAFCYLDDILDINWILNSDKTYKSARILVAFGGPNIWIDTGKKKVEGYWWGKYAEAEYCDSEFSQELDAALESLFEC